MLPGDRSEETSNFSHRVMNYNVEYDTRLFGLQVCNLEHFVRQTDRCCLSAADVIFENDRHLCVFALQQSSDLKEIRYEVTVGKPRKMYLVFVCILD